MSRKRRYLVPALLLLPVIFLCGKLLLTPVYRSADQSESNRMTSFEKPKDVAETGWPWVYASTYKPPKSNQRVLSESMWLFLADVGVLSTIVAAMALLLRWHHHRHRNWVQLYLSDFLVLTCISGAVFGWIASKISGFHHELELLGELRQFDAKPEMSYCGPQWLRRIYPVDQGQSIFSRITSVDAGGNESVLPTLQKLRHLQSLTVEGDVQRWYENGVEKSQPLITPESVGGHEWLEPIQDFKLWLAGDDRTMSVVGALPNLRFFDSQQSRISDAGVKNLAKCKSLESVTLRFSELQISDEGIASLSGLGRLSELELSGTKMTDASMETLLELKSLIVLRIWGETRMLSDDCAKRLAELPRLRDVSVDKISDEVRWSLDEVCRNRAAKLAIYPANNQ
jgi:hypothetical protein